MYFSYLDPFSTYSITKLNKRGHCNTTIVKNSGIILN